MKKPSETFTSGDTQTPRSGLSLELGHGALPRFLRLFQAGIGIKARIGCTVDSFLCEQLGIGREYLENRITTVLLDGKAVDDFSESLVEDGSVLALSTAMPGLLGAALKKGGRLASLRSNVSYTPGESNQSFREGTVVLKLFNFLAQEIGPVLLSKGIRVNTKDIISFLAEWRDDSCKGSVRIFLNGVEMPLTGTLLTDSGIKEAFLYTS
ncbi:MAG: hypothetical protein JRJ03_05940 [Deltaproteobacteria bacterium]|nr:hypothetical protein [Deltaproteobacteria bacterium]